MRLRYAYFITCQEVIKDAAGEVVELRCTYDPAIARRQCAGRPQGEGDLALGVGEADAVTARCGSTISCSRGPIRMRRISPPISIRQSLEVLPDAKLEPALADRGDQEQFGRAGPVRAAGLFRPRSRIPHAGKLVFNRTVGLRDTYAKVAPVAKAGSEGSALSR